MVPTPARSGSSTSAAAQAAIADSEKRLARGPVGVASLINRLTRPALGTRGFAGADIISHWTTIVGPELATMAIPLTLKVERSKTERAKSAVPGGTLVLRVASGAAATLLQFKGPQIISRVNSYFGYQAVARLQAVPGGVPPAPSRAAPPQPPLPDATVAEIAQTVAPIASTDLRDALNRLGVAVRRRTRPSDRDDT